MNHSEIPPARMEFSAGKVLCLPQIPKHECVALLIIACMLEKVISQQLP